MVKISENNVVSVVSNFLANSGSKFDIKILKRQLLVHNSAYSMKSISDTLKYYGFFNLVVKVDKDRLLTLPLPAIAHCKESHRDVFWFVTDMNNERVVYFDNNLKKNISFDRFVERWNGVILIAEKKNFTLYKRGNKLRWLQYLLLLLTLTLATQFILNIISDQLFFVVSILGLLLGVYGILKKYGIGNDTLINFCNHKNLKMLNCDAILHHNQSIAGISYSEMATGYFIIVLLTQLLLQNYNLIGIFSLTGAPLVLYLLYKQIFILQKICVVCSLISGIYFLQLIIIFSKIDFLVIPSLQELTLFLVIATTSIFIPILLDKFLDAENRNELVTNELFSLKTNRLLFDSLLKNSRTIDVPEELCQLIVHPEITDSIITLVVSPRCKHCLNSLMDLKKIIEVTPDTRFEVLIYVGRNKKEIDKLSYFSNGDELPTIDGVLDYITNSATFKNQIGHANEDFGKAYLQWTEKYQLDYFPQKFYNYSEIPSQYKVRDLLYILSD